MVKSIHFLSVFFLILFSGVIELYCQFSLVMPDTVIPRGYSYALPVYGSTGSQAINDFRLVVSYNSNVIEIDSVTGGPGFAMLCPRLTVIKNFDNLDSSLIEIRCSQVANNINPLFNLFVSALSGSIDTTRLVPRKLFINGSEQVMTDSGTGRIIVTGIHIYQGFLEGLGPNSPNPFAWPYMTTFPFSINLPTRASFSIYSSGGRLINSGPGETVELTIYSLDTKTTVDPGSLLNRGNYELRLQVKQPWNLSSGAYYLVMRTDNGVYSKNFMLLK
jgi:hypothetical protein